MVADAQTKVCIKCGDSKRLDEFYADSRDKTKKQGSCKSCDKKRSREWKEAHPEQHRARLRRNKLQARYGISIEQYDELLLAQDGKCACCGSNTPGGYGTTFRVDHDHTSGAIRGLLCQSCNAGIGFLGDTVEGVTQALAYLQAVPKQ